MSVALIIQARMMSTRLPGKVLLPLGGKPMLVRLLERLRGVKSPCKLVVATTTNSIDDLIAHWCYAAGVDCHRGSEHNVLERYFEAANKAQCKTVIRITSDCPLLDPALIDRALHVYRNGQVDYVSNMLPPTWPYGMAVEVFSFEALAAAHQEAQDLSEREHVTPFIYRRAERFKMLNVESTVNLSSLRWTVDTPEDYHLVTKLFDAAYAMNPQFDLSTLLEVNEKNSTWAKINQHIQQKSA